MSPPKINVTPLIDVLLVMLIIFMVVAPLRPSTFETKIPNEPDADMTGVKPNRDAIVVTVGRDMSISMNEFNDLGTPERTSALTAKLKWIFSERELRSNEQRIVFVRAPRYIPYGDVVKVIDAVKLGGAQPTALQIDRLD